MNELFDDQVIKVVKVLGEMLHDRGITTDPTLPCQPADRRRKVDDRDLPDESAA